MRRIAFDCLPTGEANQPKHLHCFGIKRDAIFVRIIIADKPLRNINATNRPAFDRWGAAGSKRPLAFRAARRMRNGGISVGEIVRAFSLLSTALPLVTAMDAMNAG